MLRFTFVLQNSMGFDKYGMLCICHYSHTEEYDCSKNSPVPQPQTPLFLRPLICL